MNEIGTAVLNSFPKKYPIETNRACFQGNVLGLECC